MPCSISKGLTAISTMRKGFCVAFKCVNVSVVTALVKFIMEILRKLFYLNFNVQGVSLHNLTVIDF